MREGGIGACLRFLFSLLWFVNCSFDLVRIVKQAKLNEGYSKVMYVTKPLPHNNNECHSQERFGVKVLTMGDGNVMDGKPFLEGVIYALSNIGQGKWKYF